MPIFEYECKACDRRFEYLAGFSETDETVVCPYCGSTDVEKMFSAFASRSGGAGCGPTSFG